jgi:hypothetical protein
MGEAKTMLILMGNEDFSAYVSKNHGLTLPPPSRHSVGGQQTRIGSIVVVEECPVVGGCGSSQEISPQVRQPESFCRWAFAGDLRFSVSLNGLEDGVARAGDRRWLGKTFRSFIRWSYIRLPQKSSIMRTCLQEGNGEGPRPRRRR